MPADLDAISDLIRVIPDYPIDGVSFRDITPLLGDAVGFIDGEIVAWGGAGSALASTIERLSEGAELVTVIAGEGAPIPLDEIEGHSPDGVELELHEGGQPSWWWLLASQ